MTAPLTTSTANAAALAQELRARVVRALADAPFDWVVLCLPENVAYVSGFRTLAETMKREPTMVAAVDGNGRLLLVGAAADAAPVLHDGIVDPDDYLPYGRFFYESPDGAPASKAADVHGSLTEAAEALLQRLGPDAVLGVDGPAAAYLAGPLADRAVVDASRWMLERRACKTAAEVERLERAALLTEDAIDDALALLRPGITEAELARCIAGRLAGGGATPKFIVVTSGERSALSDAIATDRRIVPGDLVRFDIGSVLDGYWADLGRTVVVGDPTPLQQQRYDAILAGEQAQLDLVRPGVTAAELFHVAVREVEAHGLAPYRRHHCGHAIGSEVYERPVIAPGWDDEVQEGMTFCFETPYYELGWGGMMVEDTVLVTADGFRPLNVSDRSLRVL